MADDAAALEKRIASLEGKYNVTVGIVAAVAVIFGVSGAWGGKLLSDANERIAQLQKSAAAVSATYAGYEAALKTAEETAIANVNGSAREALKREAGDQLSAFVPRTEIEQKLKKRQNLLASKVHFVVDESRCSHVDNSSFLITCHLAPPPTQNLGPVLTAAIGVNSTSLGIAYLVKYSEAGGDVVIFKPAVQGAGGFFGGGWKWEFDVNIVQEVPS